MTDYEKQINELESEIKASAEKLAWLKEQQSGIIRVPGNIKIVGINGGLGIGFNETQMLYWNTAYNIPIMGVMRFLDIIPCQLIELDVDEPEIGQLCFHTDCDRCDEEYERIWMYCIYIGNGEYIWLNDNYPTKESTCKWNFWYKVVPIEE